MKLVSERRRQQCSIDPTRTGTPHVLVRAHGTGRCLQTWQNISSFFFCRCTACNQDKSSAKGDIIGRGSVLVFSLCFRDVPRPWVFVHRAALLTTLTPSEPSQRPLHVLFPSNFVPENGLPIAKKGVKAVWSFLSEFSFVRKKVVHLPTGSFVVCRYLTFGLWGLAHVAFFGVACGGC